MNLHQPLPSSCYLNTSENASVLNSNLNSLADKLQKRKQKLHLGARKVDPALFRMMEKENDNKTKKAGSNRSRADVSRTQNKSVSTEEQDSEEESNVSKGELGPHDRLQIIPENEHATNQSVSHMTHSVSRDDCPPKANKEHAVSSAAYHQTYTNEDNIKPKFNGCCIDEAQKKFGSAKSISSEKYFNDTDVPAEYRSDLSRFTSCSSISSDDLFNRVPYESNLTELFFSSVDNIPYEEIAVCLKNGVAKVAGKLGSALSSFASSLPHEFGEY